MTRLSAAGTRAPEHAQNLSAEDRATYRRWARRSWIAYLVIVAALAVSVSLHGRPQSQLASGNVAVQAGNAATTGPQVTGAISRSE